MNQMSKLTRFPGGRLKLSRLVGMIGIALVVSCVGASSATAQTIIDDANTCLARNHQAASLGAAFGAVACFNRNMVAIAERRDEIGTMVRIVDQCRGKIERRPEAESCRIATVAGVIDQPPIWVDRGAQCGSQWNEFAYSVGRLLKDGCRMAAQNKAVQFDANGKMIIRMSGPDDALLEGISLFMDETWKSETAFQLFDRCFNGCARFTDVRLYGRYGIKGYKDMSRRYGQLVRRYREEGLEMKFADLAKTCDAVVGRWWRKASAAEQEQLACRAPARR